MAQSEMKMKCKWHRNLKLVLHKSQTIPFANNRSQTNRPTERNENIFSRFFIGETTKMQKKKCEKSRKTECENKIMKLVLLLFRKDGDDVILLRISSSPHKWIQVKQMNIFPAIITNKYQQLKLIIKLNAVFIC